MDYDSSLTQGPSKSKWKPVYEVTSDYHLKINNFTDDFLNDCNNINNDAILITKGIKNK